MIEKHCNLAKKAKGREREILQQCPLLQGYRDKGNTLHFGLLSVSVRRKGKTLVVLPESVVDFLTDWLQETAKYGEFDGHE